ncbi:serine/threonine-protein kinase [Allostreptomyces psammosilenae]|uniref:Outer membrane protein assembly factor BamB n=1 Tax=Allostreptomyces psammosilenae TaxID=1892865 RepID=A0A852ZVR9_9ACTN|nr:serine/threonine-protein kinase [Allostreptomyces psammosilenae]NYI05747.1 outer membrane protein assembly factor BamB [Allostreptomyces psammosilenae]
MYSQLNAKDPRRIGRYRLLARIGSGGMGQVYLGLAEDGPPAAIKVVRPALAEDEEFRRRFRREVAAAAAVGSAYTAVVTDADPDGESPWLATEYVPGTDLQQVVERCGPLPARTVRLLGARLAEALDAIHGAGIVHRDLKPSNILLAADGPRVIDFGISRASGHTTLTVTGVMVGTPPFMSPEHLNDLPVGPASDVFALGSLLAYCATGRSPFAAAEVGGVLYRVAHAEPAPGSIPAELRAELSACFARDPELRPTAAELARLLRSGDGASRPPRDFVWPAAVSDLIASYREAAEELIDAAELESQSHHERQHHQHDEPAPGGRAGGAPSGGAAAGGVLAGGGVAAGLAGGSAAAERTAELWRVGAGGRPAGGAGGPGGAADAGGSAAGGTVAAPGLPGQRHGSGHGSGHAPGHGSGSGSGVGPGRPPGGTEGPGVDGVVRASRQAPPPHVIPGPAPLPATGPGQSAAGGGRHGTGRRSSRRRRLGGLAAGGALLAAVLTAGLVAAPWEGLFSDGTDVTDTTGPGVDPAAALPAVPLSGRGDATASGYFESDPAERPPDWRPWEAPLAAPAAGCALGRGTLACRLYDGSVTALSPADGTVRWQRTEPEGSEALGDPEFGDEALFVVDDGYRLLALEPATGEVVWRTPLPGVGAADESDDEGTVSGPEVTLLADRGLLHVGVGGRLITFDQGTGEQLWEFTVSDLWMSPPVAGGGSVYVAGGNGALYAFEAATGRVLRYREQEPCAHLALDDDALYCVLWESAVLHRLDADTLDVAWEFEALVDVGFGLGEPALGAGMVYVAGTDGRLMGVSAATGESVWTGEVPAESDTWSGPLVVGEKLFAAHAGHGVNHWDTALGGFGGAMSLDGYGEAGRNEAAEDFPGGGDTPLPGALGEGGVTVDHPWPQGLGVRGTVSAPLVSGGVMYVGFDDAVLHSVLLP